MIVVNAENGVPVYRQIMDQVRILSGSRALKPGAKLPSIRELAVRLGVNPLTVQKAYDRLEEEGLLRKEPGRGVFIGDVPPIGLNRTEREARFRELLRSVVAEGVRLGVPPSRQLKLHSDILDELHESRE